MEDRQGRGLYGRFVRWLTRPSREAQAQWVAENYPGFRAKRLHNGRWWISSKETGTALPEVDIASMMQRTISLSTKSDPAIEVSWLEDRYPGMDLSRIEDGVWDVSDPSSGRPIVRLVLSLEVSVKSVPVKIEGWAREAAHA